jgi:hypothetical protein
MNASNFRHNLIACLVEEGKDLVAINAALASLNPALPEVSDAEIIEHGIVLDMNALPALQEKPQGATSAPVKKAKAAKPVAPVAGLDLKVVVAGKEFQVGGKFAVEVPGSQGVSTGAFAAYGVLGQISGLLKSILGDDWYAAYKQIKNPSFKEATAESREAAAVFAMRTLVALQVPVQALKGKEG